MIEYATELISIDQQGKRAVQGHDPRSALFLVGFNYEILHYLKKVRNYSTLLRIA
jgi:hypothetical protein